MKTAMVCVAASLFLGLMGCHREHSTIGDAPRKESPSSIAGWKDVSTSGVAFQLPSDWKMMDLSRESFEQGADRVLGNDPKFASMRSQASAMAKQGMVKLLAFETSTMNSGFNTNCNVVIQNMPGQMTLEQVATASVQQIAPMTANGTQPKLEYPSLKSGKVALIRAEIQSPNPAIPTLVSLAYLHVKGQTLVGVTFTGPATNETHLRLIGDQAMNAFRYTN